jgi:hypothetical protein
MVVEEQKGGTHLSPEQTDHSESLSNLGSIYMPFWATSVKPPRVSA